MRNAFYSGNKDIVQYLQAAGLQLEWHFLSDLLRTERLLPMFYYVLAQPRPNGNEPVSREYHEELASAISQLRSDVMIHNVLSIPDLVPLSMVFRNITRGGWIAARVAVELGYRPPMSILISTLWQCSNNDLDYFVYPFLALLDSSLKSFSRDDLMQFVDTAEHRHKGLHKLSSYLCGHVVDILAKHGATTELMFTVDDYMCE